MTSPRFDWWEVQAIHPDKKDPFDVYVNRFPKKEQAEAMKETLAQQGYEYINILPPRDVLLSRGRDNPKG